VYPEHDGEKVTVGAVCPFTKNEDSYHGKRKMKLAIKKREILKLYYTKSMYMNI
jgi:hypothetical protein